jgi:hypothetical protein
VTDFRYWQNKANEVQRILCMLCFDVFPVEEMFRDDEGTWDICKDCERRERETVRDFRVP